MSIPGVCNSQCLNAHIHSDHEIWIDDKHPEHFGCRTCLASEQLEAERDAAKQETGKWYEATLTSKRWREELEAERDALREAAEPVVAAWKAQNVGPDAPLRTPPALAIALGKVLAESAAPQPEGSTE